MKKMKKMKNFTVFILSVFFFSSSFAQSSLGRITFSSGGTNNSRLSVTMGQSLAGSYKSADGKTTLTVGAQANNFNNQAVKDQLSLDKETIIAENLADTLAIVVTSNVTWSVTNIPAWIRLSKANGVGDGGFNIYLDANSTSASRTATLKVAGGTITKSIIVTQKGKVNPQDELAINMSNLVLNFRDLDTVVKVTSNRSWTITNPANWLVFNTLVGNGNADVTFNVSQNNGNASRSTIVAFVAGSNTQILSVTQGNYSETAGINQVAVANLIKIYPNPVNTHLNVQMNIDLISDANLFVYDNQGKVIGKYHAEGELTSIDVSHLAAGDYFLQIVNEAKQINQQILFNKTTN